jgi:methylenetetrahydrofolate reductase (NADPH)
MVSELVSKAKVEGVHFCTLNLERSVRRVLEGLNWIDEIDAETGRKVTRSVAIERNQLIEVGLSSFPLSCLYTEGSHLA